MHYQIGKTLRRAGKLVVSLAVLALLWLVLALVNPYGASTVLVKFAVWICAFLLVLRYTRKGMRKAIWRLRNRLLVTYLFIAVIPIILVIAFAWIGFVLLSGQIATYFATTELDQKIGALHIAAESVAQTDAAHRSSTLDGLASELAHFIPGLTVTVRSPGHFFVWPSEAIPAVPPEGWGNESSILLMEDRWALWSHVVRGDTEVTATAPLTEAYASSLLPGLIVHLYAPRDLNRESGRGVDMPIEKEYDLNRPRVREPALPPAVNRFDMPAGWISRYNMCVWSRPEKHYKAGVAARTRLSVIIARIFATTTGEVTTGQFAIGLLISIGVLFLVVEIVSLIIGASLTRTITGAVHDLYVGTQRVIEGDFSYRIPVVRNDQLAELTTSFNVMTGNVERLLGVARENERYQAELEIAREVQNQLYPRTVPQTRTLRITAVCQPARMVSGDYYDYQGLEGNRLALSIGDVAGKGISAALLMATLQSAMRAQLRGAQEVKAYSDRRIVTALSTAQLVLELNQQLYAFTSAEKYATFCLGIYDDDSGELTYTNAGHLPPILVREGRHTKLETNGMVVGAFPFAKYDESRLRMKSGDLLVWYTDGITEPENEYGEMFGDDRLIGLIERNADRDDEKLISLVLDSVRQWSGSSEPFDDMTLLLARRR